MISLALRSCVRLGTGGTLFTPFSYHLPVTLHLRVQVRRNWRWQRVREILAVDRDIQTGDILSHHIFRVEVGYAETFACYRWSYQVVVILASASTAAGGGCSIICLHHIISRRGTVVDYIRVVVVLAKRAVVVLTKRELSWCFRKP